MHFVILVVLVLAVYGRDLSDAGYYPAQPDVRYDRQHIHSPPPEVTERRYGGNVPNIGNYENYRPVDLNNKRQAVNYEYDRELLNNDRNGRRHDFPNTDRRHTHGVIRDMDINLAFERQGPKRESNMNLPKQSFSINNQYSKRDDVANDDSNRSYSRNLPTQRDDGDMVFRNDDEDYHDKRKTPVRHDNNNSYNNNVPNIGIISFLNNINNTNNDINSNKQIKIQPNDSNNKNNNQIGLKSETVSNIDQRPSKTTIENEVTPNPFRKDPVVNLNTTLEEKWVWGDGEKTDAKTTTDMTTLVTLDDRAAFDGGKCATGMARIQGKCVETD